MTPTPPMDSERSDAILRMLVATAADPADDRVAISRRKRTRGILLASMAAVVVVVGAGVGYGLVTAPHAPSPGSEGGQIAAPTSDPSGPVSPRPTPSLPVGVEPAGTPTPLPTPTSAANDPADASTWLITTDGLGPVTLGQTFDQAAQEFGRAGLQNSTTCPNGPTGVYEASGEPPVYLNTGLQPTISFITVLGDVNADGSAPRTGGPKTPHGIGIGSTEAQLKAAYPNLTAARFPGYSDGTAYALTDGAGKWIDFVVSRKLGTVQEIVVNDNDEVPSEFCG